MNGKRVQNLKWRLCYVWVRVRTEQQLATQNISIIYNRIHIFDDGLSVESTNQPNRTLSIHLHVASGIFTILAMKPFGSSISTTDPVRHITLSFAHFNIDSYRMDKWVSTCVFQMYLRWRSKRIFLLSYYDKSVVVRHSDWIFFRKQTFSTT